jgi:hypothetical protein
MSRLLVTLLLAACTPRGSSSPIANTKEPGPGTPCDGDVCVLPDVAMTALGRLEFSRADLADKVVVVHFWATWAQTSKPDSVTLMKAWERFRQRSVIFFGVFTSDDSEERLRDFLIDYPIQYSLVRATPAIMAAYNHPDMIPMTYVFGRDGARVMHHVGTLDEKELMSLLEQVAR